MRCDDEIDARFSDKNSFLWWWPRLPSVPIPKTMVIPIDFDPNWLDNGIPKDIVADIKETCDEMGYPCFIRTDETSAKFDYKQSCFYNGPDDEWSLGFHLRKLFEFSLMADIIGLPVRAILVREYIPIKAKFSAMYGELPIGNEIRLFAEKGKVICHHYYWPEDAIERSTAFGNPDNWKEMLQEQKEYCEGEGFEAVREYAEAVSEAIPEYFSIDFAQAEDGSWYMIDMALGEVSWHPDCEYERR